MLAFGTVRDLRPLMRCLRICPGPWEGRPGQTGALSNRQGYPGEWGDREGQAPVTGVFPDMPGPHPVRELPPAIPKERRPTSPLPHVLEQGSDTSQGHLEISVAGASLAQEGPELAGAALVTALASPEACHPLSLQAQRGGAEARGCGAGCPSSCQPQGPCLLARLPLSAPCSPGLLCCVSVLGSWGHPAPATPPLPPLPPHDTTHSPSQESGGRWS